MDVGYRLRTIGGDFQALFKYEYDDMIMEAEEEEMMAANVAEISDEGSSDDEAAVENDVEDGGDDVEMALFDANEAGMMHRG